MKTAALIVWLLQLQHVQVQALTSRSARRSDALRVDPEPGRDARRLVDLPKLRLLRSPSPVLPRENLNTSADVEVRLGSEGHGHTFPGAASPWGMVVATPWAHGANDKWDSQAGFHPSAGSESRQNTLSFYGMAHTALSGAGSGEQGELRLLPLGEPDQHSLLNTDSVHGSPGYFSGSAGPSPHSCQMQLEATATPRAALHRFSFPKDAACKEQLPKRLVQLSLKEARGSFYGYQLKDHDLLAVGNQRLEGCTAARNSGIGGADQYMCFVMTFDAPFEPLEEFALSHQVVLEFPPTTSSLLVRVAISRTDLKHARETLDRELGQKSFEEIRASAEGLWEAALGAVKVEMEPLSRTREFYTALYHSMLFPSLMSEADGSYRLQRGGRAAADMHGEEFTLSDVDKKLPIQKTKPGHSFYSTFSSWDTYRTLHPLMNLLYPQVSADFGESLLAMNDAWGFLPPWQLLASPTDMMEGDGGSIILAKLAMDGLIDPKRALAAVKSNRQHHRGYKAGSANFHSLVSSSIEEARAEHCAADLAKLAGSDADAQDFSKQADSIFANFDTRFKVFAPPYELRYRALREQDIHKIGFEHAYTEGTPLQYAWSGEWNMKKLVDLHDGPDAFACHLESFFTTAPEPKGDQPDVSGILHGFSMGNEPDFHAPYLFSLVGRPAKTQAVVDKLVKSMYSAKNDGLPGNDDLGAMSSWLVLSMLGLFPADACGKDAVVGRPFMSSATLQLKGGALRIKVEGQGEENKYVERLTWNGKELDVGRGAAAGPPLALPWAELQKGGELVFHMTAAAPPADLHC